MPNAADKVLETALKVARAAAPYLAALVAAKGEKGAIEEIKKLVETRREARDERVKKKFRPRKTG